MDLQLISANQSGALRYETLEGRPYTVVPMVMAVEGVLEANNGPLYYPGDELKLSVPNWNSKPIVVYHPQKNGKYVSACTPDMLNTRKVGLILNTSYDEKDGKGRLKAEAWLDEERCNQLDRSILANIKLNKPMEVSTGVFSINEVNSGEFNGRKYSGLAKSLRADHLAILPTGKGASSLADGAGLLVNQAKDGNGLEIYQLIGTPAHVLAARDAGLVVNEMSFGETHSGVVDALVARLGPAWFERGYVVDVFDSYVVYNDGDELFRLDYSVDDDSVKLGDTPEKVKRQVSYVTANQAESAMNKEQIVAALIANAATKWTDEDSEFLLSLNEEQLEKMEPAPVEPPSDEGEKDPVPPTANTVDMETALASMPEPIANEFRNILAERAAQKQELVTELVANEKCEFTAEWLMGQDISFLRGLQRMTAKDEAPQPQANQSVPMFKHQPNYQGFAGAPVLQANANKEQPKVEPMGSTDWNSRFSQN